jgi:hypothetical protein
MTRWLLPIALLLALSACKGTGMSQMNYESPLADTQDEKDEDTFWDKLYGRKPTSRESKDWKDFYKAPNQDETKADYCGFWGNCAAESSKAPASCNFYGNCDAAEAKKGWW